MRRNHPARNISTPENRPARKQFLKSLPSLTKRADTPFLG
jgi:hypothetical protein